MAEVKKPRAKTTAKTAQKATDLVEMAAIPAAETIEAVAEAKPAPLPATIAGPAEAGAIFSSAKKQGDVFRKAMSEAVAASAKGALEVNDKIIDAMNSQRHAALDLWRSAISPTPLPEVLKVQSQATRQAYETASAQWKDIAETTALWFTKSLEPLQSALHRSGR
ncbi:phasin family protein [Microvirga mediterraneensis]|uniref:Phasin family protein n=1 Tax=Microvirga mediterraneensis TaxID=2754695 RepID=A0A838BUD0_9HYPH|nr:phasin family protein [Microvirga mediterraneensis]MBA1158535.1 phasin family protein [Microvirga mediterraneensis]